MEINRQSDIERVRCRGRDREGDNERGILRYV